MRKGDERDARESNPVPRRRRPRGDGRAGCYLRGRVRAGWGSRLAADSAEASSRIDFISTTPFDPLTAKNHSSLHVMNADGTGQQKLTRNALQAAW
jgi:hypothetical protein